MLGLALGATGCGAASPASAPVRTSSVAASRSRPSPTAPLVSDRVLLGQSGVLLRGLRDPQAYAAGGSLYVTQDVTPRAEAAKEVISELMRVDAVSGRVIATRRLGSEFNQAVLAAGDLWVITYPFTGPGRSSYWLLRLDPSSLVVRSRTILPATRRNPSLGSLAVAGHWLWVGTAVLDRVALATGRVDRIVKLHYPGPVQVAADRAGRVLLASLGSVHPTYIARLNSRTGALQARTTVLWSVTQPRIDGIVAGGAWIDNSTGMTTTSWRIDIHTLKTTRTQVPAIPGSRVFASVLDGILWVTKPERGQLVTYCADPVTGARLARLPRLGTNSILLTARATSIYYSDVSLKTASIVLKRAPVDSRCSS
jgi:hypothetical protein